MKSPITMNKLNSVLMPGTERKQNEEARKSELEMLTGDEIGMCKHVFAFFLS